MSLLRSVVHSRGPSSSAVASFASSIPRVEVEVDTLMSNDRRCARLTRARRWEAMEEMEGNRGGLGGRYVVATNSGFKRI